MSERTVFQSALADNLYAFIEEKRECGFKYDTAEYILQTLDKYWIDHDFREPYLTSEAIDEWCRKRDCESIAYLNNRLIATREFSRYLCGIGLPSFIPPIDTRADIKIRHPLTKDEISELFYQIDTMKIRSDAPRYKFRMVDEYPVLFRFLYLNGTRKEETCSLPINQYDPEQGTVTILNAKGDKDRLLYLSSDMNALCQDYISYLRRTLGEDTKWFFPGRDPEKYIHKSTVSHVFNICWSRTTFAKTRNIKPVVHDLRHTMVVDKINQWAAQGLSFEEMRPYLSMFLGHKSFSETLYYFHYTEEGSRILHSLDKTACKVIPKVRRV